MAARQQQQPPPRKLDPYLDGKIVCIIQETDGKSSGVGTALSTMKFIVNTKGGELIEGRLQKHMTADGSTPLPEMPLVWQHQANSQKFISQNHSTLNLDFSQFKWLGANTRTNGKKIVKGKKLVKYINVQTYYYAKHAVFDNSRLDLRCRFDVAL